MYIRIFEGIATSGKSTVIAGLKKRLLSHKLAIYTEKDTHIPIQSVRKELHLQFFSSLIDHAVSSGAEVVLFDRLYMTQAFRAGAAVTDYTEIERRLAAYDTQTILLEVDSDAIPKRLEKAMKHRDTTWGIYVRGRAESLATVATMYDAQQYAMRHFVAESLLQSRNFNTTMHEYRAVIDAICEELPLL